ncbi:hypothetical protein MPSEU_000149700 [Mayamaea pseudoterrestris]|nr:hypothetical protein MPSEU_000149700 [Mayamaea pseudoterrestris]
MLFDVLRTAPQFTELKLKCVHAETDSSDDSINVCMVRSGAVCPRLNSLTICSLHFTADGRGSAALSHNMSRVEEECFYLLILAKRKRMLEAMSTNYVMD